MRPEEILICRIFEQAVTDYKDLVSKNITQGYDNCSRYSIQDIERFFKSKWCARLLEMIGCHLTGKDILERIKNQQDVTSLEVRVLCTH